MNESDETYNRSLWWQKAEEPPLDAPALGEETAVDTCVVGAGFTGLSTALHLAMAGRSVAVLEARVVGFGASGRNGGQVIPGLKHDPDQLEARLGAAEGGILAEYAANAADKVFELIEAHQIRCAPERNGWIQAAHSRRAFAAVRERALQWQARGIPVEMLSARDVAERTGISSYFGGWRDPRAGTVQPLDYARGLARAMQNAGGLLFEGSPARSITRASDGWVVKTQGGQISAANVVLATNGYTGDLWPDLRQSFLPVQSMIIATAPLSDDQLQTVFRDRVCLSETRKLAFYMRLSPDNRLVFGGRGAVGATESRRLLKALERKMYEMFPQLSGTQVEFAWSGQVALTTDSMPHLHHSDAGLWAALGYNGRGVAMATSMGAALAAHIATGAPMPFEVSAIQRIPWHSMRRPVMNLGISWYWMRDKLGFPG